MKNPLVQILSCILNTFPLKRVHCFLYSKEQVTSVLTILHFNGSLETALLDSRSSITLAQLSAFLQPTQTGGTLLLTFVHGDIREDPATEVCLGHQQSE